MVYIFVSFWPVSKSLHVIKKKQRGPKNKKTLKGLTNGQKSFDCPFCQSFIICQRCASGTKKRERKKLNTKWQGQGGREAGGKEKKKQGGRGGGSNLLTFDQIFGWERKKKS